MRVNLSVTLLPLERSGSSVITAGIEFVGIGGSMARQLTTKAQVNGYRFLLKRLEHALVRRDVRMLHDPMRSQLQALVVGTVLGLLLLGGCGIWGLIRPQGSVGDAKIVMSKSAGAMYVIVDDTLHPVLNLASARLIAGTNASPTSVSDKKLADYPRGPLLGIPGAPDALPGPAGADSTWTVCDSSTSSRYSVGESVDLTVIGTRPELGDASRQVTADDAVLVSSGGATYLVYQIERDGQWMPVRASVDTASVPVMRALGLEGATPRQMSAGLLNTFPLAEPITVPVIPNSGRPGAVDIPGAMVGSVVKSVGLDDDTTYHVVLSDGIQKISEATAEIVRLADRDGTTPVIAVAPGRLASMPTSNTLAVQDFPRRAPNLLGVATNPTLCRSWSRDTDEPHATTALLAGHGLPLASNATPVRLTTADGPGPGVDQVYLRPGSGAYIRVTGNEIDSVRAESAFYVSDAGVRFGVADAATGAVLGLGDKPRPAPWAVVSLLTPGPTLSRQAALVSHDGIAPDPDAAVVNPPEN